MIYPLLLPLLLAMHATGQGVLPPLPPLPPSPILIIGQGRSRGDQICDYIRSNDIDVELLPHHEYVQLEDCLYYYLRDADLNATGNNMAFRSSIPSSVGHKLPITIEKIIVQKTMIDVEMSTAYMHATVEIMWTDARLTWSKAEWKTDSIMVHSQRSIWVPDLTIASAAQLSRITPLLNGVTVHNNGRVRARMQIMAFSIACATDFAKYPNDEYDCRFNIQDNMYPDALTFRQQSHKLATDVNYVQSSYEMIDAGFDVKSTFEEDVVVVMFVLRRASTWQTMVLYLPMCICALLLVLAPFFGTMKTQIGVRLFTLLLQIMAFNMLANSLMGRTSDDRVPPVFRFYEWTMFMTLIGVILTSFMLAMSRQQRSMPLKHSMALTARTLNARLFVACIDKGQFDYDVHHGEDTEERTSWLHMTIAMNCISSFVVFIAYCIGLLVIFA